MDKMPCVTVICLLCNPPHTADDGTSSPAGQLVSIHILSHVSGGRHLLLREPRPTVIVTRIAHVRPEVHTVRAYTMKWDYLLLSLAATLLAVEAKVYR
ncbi:hypothetical protein LSH36_164g06033 [Paralvinella palmiformis]|uniref:Uncharacterized protein n=1 Tax=Paralvinella palmiformis TaxID=53620 RepID=A0AAD9JTT9_9ANNE|nr:hypothetical protein LSH36_164g06033 [Paralvinella palmiformis]